MGFLDKAKAAAMDLQQKADTAMSNSGLMGGNAMGSPGGGGSGSSSAAADRLLRNLGVLTYLNASGRPGATEDYHRIMDELRGLEASGGLNLTLTPAAPAGFCLDADQRQDRSHDQGDSHGPLQVRPK